MTTLLSKESENRQQQAASGASPAQVKELQQQVADQGAKVKDAKAVSVWAVCVCCLCGVVLSFLLFG